MKVHLVDGTYELFRQHFGRMSATTDAGRTPRRSACCGSTLQLLADGATHVGVASDHVIESFRNDLWPGYKTSAGMPPELLEPDPDGRGGAGGDGRHDVGDGRATRPTTPSAPRPRSPTPTSAVEQVLILTPGQGPRAVRARTPGRPVRPAQAGADRRGRRRRQVRRRAGVDPRLPRARRRLRRRLPRASRVGREERRRRARPLRPPRGRSPPPAGQWDVPGLRGAAKLAATLQDDFELALLFRRIATLETDIDVGTRRVVALDRPDRRRSRRWPRRLQAPELVAPGCLAGVATALNQASAG